MKTTSPMTKLLLITTHRSRFVKVELVWYNGRDLDDIVELTPHSGDVGNVFPARKAAREVEDVIDKPDLWIHVCFVTCLSVNCDAAENVIRTNPEVPGMAGQGVLKIRQPPIEHRRFAIKEEPALR